VAGRYLKRTWTALRRPNARYSAGALLFVGLVAGILFWGGFNTAVEATNSVSFCISCHEMRNFVYEEYKQSAHYRNPSGVRATCADCHVPREWGAKMVRKVRATYNELPKKILGTISTREKFEARRLVLAEHVWNDMKASDSRECRNCHTRDAMALADQKPRARGQHEDALKTGETCIDCHQGIAHKKPRMPATPGGADDADGGGDGFAL
jgi:cytochrome c-type protein NapC